MVRRECCQQILEWSSLQPRITAPRREAQVHAGHHRGCRSSLIPGLWASAAPQASLSFPLEVPGLDVNAVQFRM